MYLIPSFFNSLIIDSIALFSPDITILRSPLIAAIATSLKGSINLSTNSKSPKSDTIKPLLGNCCINLPLAVAQASSSFRSVLAAFALIILQFEQLSSLVAATNRVAILQTYLTAEKIFASTIDNSKDSHIKLEHLTLQTPDYQTTLVQDLSVAIKPKNNLLIVGASGVGKSSLLRAIAKLWQSGTGLISKPASNEIFFLPQKPYMVLGTLKKQILYPQVDKKIEDQILRETFKKVNLFHFIERFDLDTEKEWSTIMSLGEQQRLAFARLLIAKPKYAILDEATSALDSKNEELLYQLLQEANITYISVGHRISLVKYHQQILKLKSDKSWELHSHQQFQQSLT